MQEEGRLVNKRTVQIEWGDCDPAGIVFYPRYFEFFDASTNALFERVGLPYHQMIAKYAVVGVPIVEAHAKFLAPCAFGETVIIASSVTQWSKRSFTVEHKVFHEQVLCVEGYEKRVWAVRGAGERKRMKSHAIPREVIESFAARKHS
jgi:4-hydroxybenzoyl-CoA thioesterase